ncbi:pectinesterase family protein [Marinomonas mediterranea]|jgi:Pectin methylesterase|uniref:Pectinesterase n=1 Tax=Marinomonas mediterranea (strain ATCC 700492 / JCM 21426 / NBRC 103028 / MMB-1) TaxID=717774 RepID=F2K2G1_MARM1|nr:pectinesterase family protein [Marinomonas mediterranea]ADZ92341.1 Pectinesterase [Marinomonas mediterranea MMB-1]WCN18390.1 pectinesterase A [Marinomonas mediterranea MMB-1]
MSKTHYSAHVSQSRKPSTFSSITHALQSAPDDNRPFTIHIDEGVYEERLNITRNNVHLVGAGKKNTVITGSMVAGQLNNSGELISTLGSRTLMINATDCSLTSLTIRNDFDYINNALLALDSNDRVKHTQAVALLLGNDCDRCIIDDVRLQGFQDTLFVKGSRSYFYQCDITGNIDFIFGNGNAVFDQCTVVARNTPTSLKSMGYLTAPSTPLDQEFGLTFLDCQLVKESADIPIQSYALGRPWHPTTSFSDGKYADPNAIGKTTFIRCFMGDHIYGWDKMGGKDKHGNQIYFLPECDARFNEYQCHGPGANSTRFQLSSLDAHKYSIDSILEGWLPKIAG